MCYHPTIIKTEEGIKKTAPCGKCAQCIKTKRNGWFVRLRHELSDSKSAYFITLTYDELNVPKYQSLQKIDMQQWLKRLRKQLKSKLRYYLVGEYGSKTRRPHYHALLFFEKNVDQDLIYRMIKKTWQKGQIHIGNVTDKSIYYCTKYIIPATWQKTVDKSTGEILDNREPIFTLMSRRPGIGAGYVNRYKQFHKDNLKQTFAVAKNGEKRLLPRYYADKIYTKQEKHMIRQTLEEKTLERDRKHLKNWEKKHPNSHYGRYLSESIKNQERKIRRSKTNTL